MDCRVGFADSRYREGFVYSYRVIYRAEGSEVLIVHRCEALWTKDTRLNMAAQGLAKDILAAVP